MTLTFVCLVVAAPTPVTVDANAPFPISPYVYGANHPDWDKLRTPFPLARQGGNRMTAYNWETNASNAGSDYRHQNDSYLGASNEPGWTVRTFFQAAQSHGGAALVTVPTAGYVSADKGPDNDVNRTPNYLKTRFHRSLAKKPGGRLALPPNTRDKFVYQDEFVAWVQRTKSNRTPVWFSLDNEPDLWAHTHARIVPKPLTYAGIIANNVQFASAIKAVAPNTRIFGPANYGWQGFRTFQNAPDAKGRDFLDVYLRAMRQAERKAGRRLLDALDVHWYPEARGGGERIVMGQEKPGTAAARLQASRSLWDPTYVENSWIAQTLGNKPIVLLPNLRRQIDRNYPGTKLAITEYDFGGGSHVSGTIAQADVLGLFGRHGVWAACHWGISDNRPATLAGFRAFLNFDGRGAKFARTGLRVTGERPAENAVFAARDGRRLTLVVINKTGTGVSQPVLLKGFRPRTARAFVADPQNPLKPKPGRTRLAGNGLVIESPPMSVVTVEAQG